MAVVPPSNLPPESQPWGREVDAAVRQLQFESVQNAQSTSNALAGINNTLTAMSKQISDIAAATAAASSAAAAAAAAAGTANAAIADLAARVSVTTSLPSFNTGTLPNDSADHTYGSPLSITINVPTGKLTVTIGCGQATVNAGVGGAVIAEATFQIPGVVNLYDVYARMFNSNPSHLAGSSMVVSRSFSVTPGVHTITGYMSAWCSTTGASVQFGQPYMTVQVTG